VSRNQNVAMLRGINVGGNNMLPMKDLVAIFEKAGCKNVRTYIQSGNVVFECAASVARVQTAVGAAIEKKFGFNPPLVMRQAADLEDVLKNNPFLKTGAKDDELHVVFLSEGPTREATARLEQNCVPPDEFIVRGKEIYLRLPNGAGRSKLAVVPSHPKFGVIATARNWRTVNKLFQMMS
jgi:uncharacterized protein (DUF1697 family)